MTTPTYNVNPALSKFLRPIAELSLLKRNPREHGPKSLDLIRRSLVAFGQQKPIVVDEAGVVIAGNGQLLVAKELEWTHVAAVTTTLTEEQRKAYSIADNKSAEASAWDDDVLGELLGELPADLMLSAGFSQKDLEKLLDSDDEDGEPETPEPPKEPRSKAGDLYRLGAHRVLCGDSTDEADVARLIGDRQIDCVFTDPPYAIYGSSTGIASDICDDKMVRPFFRGIVRAALSKLKRFGHVYICCDWRSWASWWEIGKGTGLAPKNMIVWNKDGAGLGSSYANVHELLLFGWHLPMQKAMTEKQTGGRTVNDVNIWQASRVTGKTDGGRVHNAQKPCAIIRRALKNSTNEGELVLDLFGGSGSTLIACEQENRAALLMEISPAYVDVIVERWEKFTGRKAELIAEEPPLPTSTKPASADPDPLPKDPKGTPAATPKARARKSKAKS
jgi:DNA modification methylase